MSVRKILNKIIKIKNYIITILIVVFFIVLLIVFTFEEEFLVFISIFLSGISTCASIYNIVNEYYKTKQEKENIREILTIEVKSTTSSLEKFLNHEINHMEIQTGDNIKLWYKFSVYLNKTFKQTHLDCLYKYFTKLEEIEELKSDRYINEKYIENTALLGERILKEVFNKEDKLELGEDSISIIEVESIINSKNYKSLEQKILKINKQGKSEKLLKKIMNNFKISKDRAPLFIDFLFKNWFILDIPVNVFEFYKEDLISKTLFNLINELDDHQQLNIIKKNILREDTSLFIFIWLLQDYGKKFLNSKQLKQMNNIILDKIHMCNKRGKLLSCYHLNIILHYWCSIENKEVVENFIKEALKDENKIIQFIEGFIKKEHTITMDSEHFIKKSNKLNPHDIKIKYTFDFNIMESLIDLEYIKKKVNKKQYVNKHQKLIEEFKRQIEEKIKNNPPFS